MTFRIVFHGTPSPLRTTPAVHSAANTALDVLKARIARLGEPVALDDESVDEATMNFHAVWEGPELRGTFPADAGERIWRQGLSAIIRGLAGGRRHVPMTRRP